MVSRSYTRLCTSADLQDLLEAANGRSRRLGSVDSFTNALAARSREGAGHDLRTSFSSSVVCMHSSFEAMPATHPVRGALAAYQRAKNVYAAKTATFSRLQTSPCLDRRHSAESCMHETNHHRDAVLAFLEPLCPNRQYRYFHLNGETSSSPRQLALPLLTPSEFLNLHRGV